MNKIVTESSPLLSSKPSSSLICSHKHLLQNNQKEASRTKKKLIFACTLAFFFFITEVTAGYLANSLGHSYGFHRAEVIAAIISVFTIWILTGFLVTEAFHRISHPQKIDAKVMCVTASIGVLINIILAYVLGGHHHHHHHSDEEQGKEVEEEEANNTIDHLSINKNNNEQQQHSTSKKTMKNINLQAAALHVLGDLLASLGVLISSIILWIKPEYSFVDPLCTFLFSMIVMYTTYHLMKDSFIILMEGVPLHLSLEDIETSLLYHFKSSSSIQSIHDVHLWTLSPGKLAFSCHVVVMLVPPPSLPPSPSSSSTSLTINGNSPKKTASSSSTTLSNHVDNDIDENQLLLQIQTFLANEFQILHSTIQIEKTFSSHFIHDHCYISPSTDSFYS